MLGLGVYVVMTAYRLQPLHETDYGVQECSWQDSANSGAEALRILDAVYVEPLGLFSSFCESSSVKRQFSAVAVRSVHRDRFDLRDLYEATYQLVLAKPELISRGRKGIQYELIARYPDYGSQLVSLHGTPELSAAWLNGKVLGLLDDANSISAYQIPIAALRAAGLEEVPRIIRFRSYRQMYRALYEGSVDVIPALVSDEGPTSRLQLPPGLVLEETIPGPAWYLQRALLDSEAHCALQEALQDFSRSVQMDFFRRLISVRSCAVE
ncbi:MAG: hypothetical protein Hals2KO_26520 [Halioglobus sp.]